MLDLPEREVRTTEDLSESFYVSNEIITRNKLYVFLARKSQFASQMILPVLSAIISS